MDFLRSMAILIDQPWLALLPAALFAGFAVAVRSRVALVVACIWTLYCFYELAMKWRILCSGECNIRIDLLALYPLLLLATGVGLVAVVPRMVRRQKT
jgi:hypothetical protein